MQRLIGFLSLISLLLFSCQVRRILPLDQLNNAKFEPLKLQSAHEGYNFRIDILRQTSTEYSAAAEISTTEKVPYHPVGFDLGNGLFMDVNHNLSLSITRLLNIQDADSFQLKITYAGRAANPVVYTIEPDRYCWENHSKERCYDTPMEDGKRSFYNKNKKQYAVSVGDDELTFIRNENKPKWNVDIKPERAGYYRAEKGKGHLNYQLEGNEINLAGGYLLERTEDGRKLNCNSQHYILQTLLKSCDFLGQ